MNAAPAGRAPPAAELLCPAAGLRVRQAAGGGTHRSLMEPTSCAAPASAAQAAAGLAGVRHEPVQHAASAAALNRGPSGARRLSFAGCGRSGLARHRRPGAICRPRRRMRSRDGPATSRALFGDDLEQAPRPRPRPPACSGALGLIWQLQPAALCASVDPAGIAGACPKPGPFRMRNLPVAILGGNLRGPIPGADAGGRTPARAAAGAGMRWGRAVLAAACRRRRGMRCGRCGPPAAGGACPPGRAVGVFACGRCGPCGQCAPPRPV